MKSVEFPCIPTAEVASKPQLSEIGLPAAGLHLYGKTEAKAERKMGHLIVLPDSPPQAVEQALAARGSLAGEAASGVVTPLVLS